MGFFDFFFELSPSERVSLVIWLLICILPFVIAAILIKKRIKVGKIDLYAFLVYFGCALGGLYFGLTYFTSNQFAGDFMTSTLGIWVGIILFLAIFNQISEGVKKAFIIQFELEKTNLNIRWNYIYQYCGYNVVIQLDLEGHESLGDMFRRIRGKRTFIINLGKFEFTEHNINTAYLCLKWMRKEVTLHIDDEDVLCDCVFVTPIPATEFSQLQFLLNWQKWSDFEERHIALYNENQQLQADIFMLACRLFEDWAKITEKAQWGEERKTVKEIIGKYRKELNNKKEKEAEAESSEKEAEAEAEGPGPSEKEIFKRLDDELAEK